MKIAKMAAALAAVTMIAAPIAASANTRAAPIRYTTQVKKTNKATDGLLIAIPVVAVVAVGIAKLSKSSGA